jgi:alkanesulfonate monooxygenase SsuD/methylene tetrahydromethanopterin reductase-like flavin-dependent oxidoreductase (luciferase family)
LVPAEFNHFDIRTVVHSVTMVAADYQRAVRVFLASGPDGNPTELTAGIAAPIRVSAPDLQRAQRLRSRIRRSALMRGDDPDRTAVIIDLRVAVADDFRSARAALASTDTSETLSYAGTTAGLVGLIADIYLAGVADGVTLIPHSDLDGADILARLARRLPVALAA